MAKRIVAIVVVVAALGGLLYYSQVRPRPRKISGFLEADEIRLGSRVGGRVQKIHVNEGDRVKAGALLVDLDPYELLDLRAQAQAAAAMRQAELAKLQAGFRPEDVAQAKARCDELEARLAQLVAGPRKETIAAARARVDQAAADFRYGQASLVKIRASFDARVATREEFDKATQFLESTKATETMRRAELAELEAGSRPEDVATARAQLDQARQAWQLQVNGPRKEDIDAAGAALASAQAALKAVETQITELHILAPVDGTVEAFELRPGDLVAANAPAMSLLDPGKLWVRAFLPEDLPGVAVGQKLTVTVDSLPGRRFAAHVAFIARQAEFTPSNVQTPEKRSKQVFRVKVTLDEGLDVLRAGMPADVWLDGPDKK
ncbi:MAG: efflux RND transporter periplasmic adaptor subunit [Planctomycetota bacterium]